MLIWIDGLTENSDSLYIDNMSILIPLSNQTLLIVNGVTCPGTKKVVIDRCL